MGVFDDISKGVDKLGRDSRKAASNLKETVKINSQISEEKKRINDNMLQLGRAYYELMGSAPHEKLKDICDKIGGGIENIRTLEVSLMEIEQQKNPIVCPNCGGRNKEGALFCLSCGVSLVAPQGKVCPTCGAAATFEAKFCVNCGTSLLQQQAPEQTPPQEIRCPGCGIEAALDSKFCISCGSPLQAPPADTAE